MIEKSFSPLQQTNPPTLRTFSRCRCENKWRCRVEFIWSLAGEWCASALIWTVGIHKNGQKCT